MERGMTADQVLGALWRRKTLVGAIAAAILALGGAIVLLQPSEYQATMRVHDLLSMSTGHAEDTTLFMRQQPDGNWAKAFLARPVEHTPGTHFLYNTGATYMLSAIIQRLTGGTLLDYLRPRLLTPWRRPPAFRRPVPSRAR